MLSTTIKHVSSTLRAIDCVGFESDELKSKAACLAEKLQLRLDKEAALCLYFTMERLTLKIPSFNLLYADFSIQTWDRRKAEGKNQALVRACKPRKGLTILDATAGWGRDAAILASLGANVLMLERHPVMAALLEDALLRQNEDDMQAMSLSLVHQDALSYLQLLEKSDYPDIIYIDPMHPQRTKSALVKKDLYVLQELIGPDEDALALLHLALTKAKQKVVVKWPQKIPALLKTHSCMPGKTIRYDIYTAL